MEKGMKGQVPLKNDNYFGDFMVSNIDSFREVLMDVSDPLRHSKKPSTDFETMAFALECALILIHTDRFNKSEIKVIQRGLEHDSQVIRNKAIYTTLALLDKRPEIALEILRSLCKNVIPNYSAWGSIERCFPIFQKKNNACSDSFISLVIILLGDYYKNIDIQNFLVSMKNSVTRVISSREACSYVINNDDEKHKEARSILYELAKPHFPSALKLVILLVPFVEPLILKMYSPVISGLMRCKGPVSFVSKKVKKSIVGFLVKSYSSKCNPCHAIEMTCFMAGEIKKPSEISKNISSLYGKLQPDEDDIKLILEYAALENGLVAWYMYTLIPYYMTVKGDQQTKVLQVIQKMFDSESDVSKYVALNSLWIIRRFLWDDVLDKQEQIESLLDKYSMEFIIKNGRWLKIEHSGGYSNKYSSIVKMVEVAITNKNELRECFLEVVNFDDEVIRYDNSVLLKYAEFLAVKEPDKIVVVILKALNETVDCGSEVFLLHAIDCLGNMGERYPEATLSSLKQLCEAENELSLCCSDFIMSDKYLESMANAILKTNRVHPLHVRRYMILFPERLRSLVDQKLSSFKGADSVSLSYYGDLLYQRLLLNPEVREKFAEAIAESGAQTDLDDFFASYVGIFFDWLVKDLTLQ